MYAHVNQDNRRDAVSFSRLRFRHHFYIFRFNIYWKKGNPLYFCSVAELEAEFEVSQNIFSAVFRIVWFLYAEIAYSWFWVRS